ncbi:MAG: nucleoside-diphosphate kinase [Actinobacteria bacterium]|nr:nucleoside-diphosphate kinase [Actinomycetota bacterium]
MEAEKTGDKILESVASDKKITLIEQFSTSGKENETLFFLKPEFFQIPDIESIKRLLLLIFKKIDEFEIEISGIATLTGSFLAGSKIIERHYGFINKMSVSGSKIVNGYDKVKIMEALSLGDLKDYKILGGHEAVNRYGSIDEKMLTELWYSKEAKRIGEGFYIQPHTINGDKVILINGFHPNQIRHYTNPASRIVLFLLSTDTDWFTLRNNFVGDTFPERAAPGSIRALLYRDSGRYGIGSINVANNFVHASSGPYDAVFEICNFVGNLEGINYCRYNTNIYKLMIEKFKLAESDFLKCLENPAIKTDDSETDLFTITKNKNTFDAISKYISYFKS